MRSRAADRAHARRGTDRVQLVGASLGGMVVQHVALARPDLVDRLVLVATTLGGTVAHPLPEGIMPEDLLARLDPAWVSPLVGWLAADACTETGHVYSVAGGYYARVAVVEREGVAFDAPPSPDQLGAANDRLTRLGEVVEPQSLADPMALVTERATAAP